MEYLLTIKIKGKIKKIEKKIFTYALYLSLNVL